MKALATFPEEQLQSEALVNAGELVKLGQAANHYAARNVFADYQSRRAENTLRRQAAGLALFAAFLRSAGVEAGDLGSDPKAWTGVTWGLVEAFSRWQLANGYAITSANVRLSTVKTYAKMAAKAGAIDRGELALIIAVSGFAHHEQKNLDERRQTAGLAIRKGPKKAEFKALTAEQVKAIKAQPDSPQGRRDALLVCLMLDLGLRVGEVAALGVDQFKITVDRGQPKHGELTFYRPKVDKVQTHELRGDVLQAAWAYLSTDAPALGPVWRGSTKPGGLVNQGMSARAITRRAAVLGAKIGVDQLSAHDLRHTWATLAARNGTPLDRLMDAGGWNSPSMPMRYIQAAKIANQGVIL